MALAWEVSILGVLVLDCTHGLMHAAGSLTVPRPPPPPNPLPPSPRLYRSFLFIYFANKILGAFEANAFSEHDLRLARERWAAAGSPASSSAVAPSSQQPAASRGAATQPGSSSKRKRGGDRGPATAAADAGAMEVEARGGVAAGGGGGAPVYFGLKYLTSSRLLKLQLRDPTLRLQV